MSTLATLARVARREAEEVERQLAASEARLREAHARRDAHDEDVARESALARASAEAALAFGAFARAARRRRQDMEAEEAGLAAETAALRDVLRDAFIELKKIEILIERQQARAAAEERALDQAAMDDIATSMMRARG